MNPTMETAILTHLNDLQIEQGNQIEIIYCSHERFKQLTHDSKAVILEQGNARHLRM